MNARRWLLLGTALVASTLLVSSLGGSLTPADARPQGLTGPAPLAPPSATPRASPPALLTAPAVEPTASVTTGANFSASPIYGINQAAKAVADHSLPSSSVFFPRLPAPGQPIAPGAEITGPEYPGIPAPMGVADVGHGKSGSYAYNSSSFAGTVDVRSLQDYNPGYAAYGEAPNWLTFQLNTVTLNTSYPGATNGVFWIQNVAHYNGSSLELEDNIWNFSSPTLCLEAGTLLSGAGGITHCIYLTTGPVLTVAAPFTLSLYNNISLVPGLGGVVPEVTFGYLINESGVLTTGVYDTVLFDGRGSGAAPPEFGVNGYNLAPTGFTYWDSEFVLGGNGGGANAVLQEINASLQLQYLNSHSQYVNVPSAYDYGADTAETSYGVAATYFGATENLTAGPSMLYGLWNTTNGPWGAPAPTTTWDLTVTGMPSYGFAFLQNSSDYALDEPALSYWPASSDGTLTTTVPALLDGNTFTLVVYANGFDTGVFTITGPGTSAVALTANAAEFDTPVYLNTDAQEAAFGTSGVSGVQSNSRNLWINDTMATVAAPFLLTNDFRYPTFVLFAEQNLSRNVRLDRFVQDPTTFNYTSSEDPSPFFIYGWTQGYYFNYGSGRFSVTNTSVIGNSTIFHSSGEVSVPLPAVEFWWTFDSTASHITTAGNREAVDVFFGAGSSVSDVAASDGANGTFLFGTIGAQVHNVVADGTDIVGARTLAATVEGVRDVTVENITAENGAWTLNASSLDTTTFTDIKALTDSEGVLIDGATDSHFTNLTVDSGVAGTIESLSGTVIRNVDLTDTSGLDLLDATDCTVTNVTVQGGEGLDVDTATDLNVTTVNASADAVGLQVLDATGLHLTGVTAGTGSFGAGLEASKGLVVGDVHATGLSVGLGVEESLNISVTDLHAGSGSLGLFSGLNEWLNLTNYNATESARGANYFSSTIGLVPTAAVYTFDDQNTTLKDGVATEYNYGVVSNGSNYLTVTDLHEVAGIWGVALDGTGNSTIGTSFVYGNQIGLWTDGTENLDVDVVTIEASSGYGLWLDAASDAQVALANFVGNNGASTDGVFSASHLQAGVAGVTTAVFNPGGLDNYWSDWNASVGAYPIATGISDPHPLTAFYSNWLAFTEVGLPHGTTWGILLDGTSYSSDLPIAILPSYSLGDPTFQFTVEPPALFIPSPPSGSVDFTGANTTVVITFTQNEYDVTFSETGLATSTSWKVTLDGVTETNTTSTITFVEPAGMYNWSTSAVGYTAAPPNGTVDVVSASTGVDVTFTAIPTYAVTFSESGLSSGTSWSVTFNGTPESSTTSTIVVLAENGTYPYTIESVTGYNITSPASGNVPVSGGPQTVDVTFAAIAPPMYAVTFTESGLVSGTEWKVTLGTTTEISVNSTVAFDVAAGSYTYTVGAVANYTAAPDNGTVVVTTGPQGVSITFSALPPPTYSLRFVESGLPTGTSWSVTIGGVTHSSTNSTVLFAEPAGSYPYTVPSPVAGYVASPTGGTAVVTSSGGSVSITFTLPAPAPTNKSSGLLFGLSEVDWVVIGAVIALLVAAVLVALFRRGRGRSGESTGSTSDSGAAPPSDIDAPEPGGAGDAYE